jgi:predicted RecB family endonuclease
VGLTKVIADKRQTGKTTKLIYASHITGARILCMNRRSIGSLKDLARELKVDIPNPICVSDIQCSDVMQGDILVDNADYVLQELLGCKFNVVAMTTSITTYQERGGVDFGS